MTGYFFVASKSGGRCTSVCTLRPSKLVTHRSSGVVSVICAKRSVVDVGEPRRCATARRHQEEVAQARRRRDQRDELRDSCIGRPRHDLVVARGHGRDGTARRIHVHEVHPALAFGAVDDAAAVCRPRGCRGAPASRRALFPGEPGAHVEVVRGREVLRRARPVERSHPQVGLGVRLHRRARARDEGDPRAVGADDHVADAAVDAGDQCRRAPGGGHGYRSLSCGL